MEYAFSRGSFPSFFAFQDGMLGTPISVLGGWPTVSGHFVRQVFISTRTILFFPAENVALHLPREAGATQERHLTCRTRAKGRQCRSGRKHVVSAPRAATASKASISA